VPQNINIHNRDQCCGSGSESGSIRIRNFLQDPDPDMDPQLEVMDSDPDPKQEMHLIKNHLKIIKIKEFDNYDIRKTLI
jgi:hypothetical protein